MKKKFLSVAIAITLGAALLGACSDGKDAAQPQSTTTPAPKETGAPSAKPTGDFRFFINAGATWDPALWDWGAKHDQIGIFEGLVHFSQGKVVPGIATSWKEEGNKWTFTLRKDNKFSNGDPVDAETFVYSFRRAVDSKTVEGTGKASSFMGDVHLKNWQQAKTGQLPLDQLGVRSVDQYTLEITLEEPDKALLEKLAINPWALPVDPKVVKGAPATIWQDATKIVSNGPYMVESLNVKTDMVLKPNPYYHGNVTLEKIHMTWANASTKQLLVYKNNESDMALLQPEDIVAAKGDAQLQKELMWFDAATTYTFQIRHSKDPALQNEKVRQALAMAIDKQGIADKVLNGTGQPAYDGWVTPWMADWIKDVGLKYDPAKAKQLLAEAGYPNGKGLAPIKMLVAGASDKVAQAVQQMWEQNLGVKVEYQGEEWGTYVTKLEQFSEDGTVSVVQNGIGATLPNWKESIVPQDATKNELAKMAMDADKYQGYLDIKNDPKLDPAARREKTINHFTANFPKAITDQISKGIEAYNKNDDAGMKSFVQWRAQSAWVIPVYQVRNGVLLKPNVKGYFPMRMWLTTPPDWLNDITIK